MLDIIERGREQPPLLCKNKSSLCRASTSRQIQRGPPYGSRPLEKLPFYLIPSDEIEGGYDKVESKVILS